jgi:hypothetical protein
VPDTLRGRHAPEGRAPSGPRGLITEADVQAARAAGQVSLKVAPGSLVTPAARDLASEIGLLLEPVLGEGPGKHGLICPAGFDYCILCSTCLTSDVFDRKPEQAGMSTVRVLQLLERFTAAVWPREPADVRELRSFRLPPMGNLPCVIYANFDLFWAGEMLQVCRDAAKQEKLALPQLNLMAGLMLKRAAARLGKWKMTDTVRLMVTVARYFEDGGTHSPQEFLRVVESTLVALDRVQSAIDAMIPWSKLDSSLRLTEAAEPTSA